MIRIVISLLLSITPLLAHRPLPPGVTVKKDIAYVENGHARQKLDLYFPTNSTKNALPMVIYIHGGAWLEGSKEQCPALDLLNHGFAVASINYRLSQHALFPAQIEDCKAAVRFIRAHAKEWGIDPKKVGVCGTSAGGHLVAMLGTACEDKQFEVGAHLDQSSRPTCVCNFFGVSDLTTIHQQSDPQQSVIQHQLPTSPESKLIGGTVADQPEQARAASPVFYVSKNDVPMLLLHGTKDRLVPYAQSVQLHEALKKAGVASELHTVEGAGHGDGFGKPEQEAALQFFQKYLQPS